MVDLVHYAVLAWAGCPWMPIDAVWSLHCNAHQNAVRAPHSHWTGSGGSRTGMLVHSNSLWLLMLRGSRQGIFSGCAGSNACNATVARLWAGEAAFIPLLSIGIAWGHWQHSLQWRSQDFTAGYSAYKKNRCKCAIVIIKVQDLNIVA